MNQLPLNHNTILTGLLSVSALVMLVFWALIPEVSGLAILAYTCGLAVVGISLWYLVPGSELDFWWGGGAGAAIVVLAIITTYWIPIDDLARLIADCVFIAAAAVFRGSWSAGLRVGWTAWMVSSWGLALIFLTGFRTPWMATQLDFSGTVDRFRDSSAISFWPWAVSDLWGGFLFRVFLDGALGAFGGFLPRLWAQILARR